MRYADWQIVAMQKSGKFENPNYMLMPRLNYDLGVASLSISREMKKFYSSHVNDDSDAGG